MRRMLQIGEAAKLLGITTKTIRHYHKVGLLAVPPRTEAGYRLYGAGDLLRLRRIRQLQALGFSLARIREMLGAPDDAPSLGRLLRELRSEMAEQIALLQARLARIEQLLAEERWERLEALDEPSALLAHAQATLAPQLAMLDPTLVAQVRAFDEKLFALMEGFVWPTEMAAHYEQAIAFFTAHPDAYQRLAALAARFLALDSEPEESPAVEALAVAVQSQLADLPPALVAESGGMADPFRHTLGELMNNTLTPAQRRLITLIQERADHKP